MQYDSDKSREDLSTTVLCTVCRVLVMWCCVVHAMYRIALGTVYSIAATEWSHSQRCYACTQVRCTAPAICHRRSLYIGHVYSACKLQCRAARERARGEGSLESTYFAIMPTLKTKIKRKTTGRNDCQNAPETRHNRLGRAIG
jgi:hypothetical protein